MARLHFYPLEASYALDNDRAVVQLFGRTEDGQQVVVLDSTFPPYFWVLPEGDATEAAKHILQEKAQGSSGAVSAEKAEVMEKLFLGRKVAVIKVAAKKPADVPPLREALRKFGVCMEADILFTRRYLIDRSITPLALHEAEGEYAEERYKVPALKARNITAAGDDAIKEQHIMALDIETYNAEGKMPDAEHDPVIMAALAEKDYRKVITWKKFETAKKDIQFVENEKELLRHVAEIVDARKPDIISGYFSDGFDLPYLKRRAEKLGIRLDMGLDYSQPRIRKNGNSSTAEITGIAHLDVLNYIKKIHKVVLKTPVYDLNTVAKEVLGEGKTPVKIEELYRAWDTGEGLELFCEYNLQDALLTLKLSEAVLPNLIEFSRLLGLPPADVSRLSFSQIVEWYLIKQAPRFNELAPNRPGYQELAKRKTLRYEGGFVYQPQPGLYENMVVFDFLSLYPTIISSHNISPDVMDCECCGDIAEKIDGTHWFCQQRKGFISSVIEDVINRRMRVKEILKKAKGDKLLEARQQALKTVANSIYGYFGFFGARWYSAACASAITAYGRKHIKDVIESARQHGFRVIYGDTDSLFVVLEGKSKNEALKWMGSINEKLPGIMELEYEGFYPAGIFVSTRLTGSGAKKKYALLNDEGRLKIRGFESVRRNLSKVAKETQQQVLNIILMEKDPAKALGYVKNVIKNLREKKIPVEKTVIATQLQREVRNYDAVGPHVAVARRMQERGMQAGPGSIISYVVVQGSGNIGARAKLPAEVQNQEYDAEYYVNNQVLPAVSKILEVVGFSENDIAADHKQSTLEGFFG